MTTGGACDRCAGCGQGAGSDAAANAAGRGGKGVGCWHQEEEEGKEEQPRWLVQHGGVAHQVESGRHYCLE